MFRFYGDSVTLRRKPKPFRWCAWLLILFAPAAPAWAQAAGNDQFDSLLQQGFQIHQQARYSESIPVLRQALRLEPGDYFVNLLLGIDLLRTGKPAEAIPHLQLAARTRPGEEFPVDYLGEAQASLGHHALAAEAYQQAVQRSHSSEQALEAWAGFALERFHQIGEVLRASDAGVAAARNLAAAAATPASQICEGPIQALERKLAVPGANAKVQVEYKLSICYAIEAGKAAAQLQSSAEDLGAVHRLRGDVLLRLKGDATGAAAEYREAIALRRGDPALLERLAEALVTIGDTDGAHQAAEAALAIDPHRRNALHTLASLDMANRDYEAALPRLRQLLEQSPSDRTLQVELGRALAQTGDSEQARHLLAPALAAGYPDEKGALHALLGRVLRKLGREAEAARAEAESRRLADAAQARQNATEKPNADQ